MNENDAKRDKILRYLHERHKTARGIGKIAVGIQELQREMKKRHGLSQADVSSNLDYLVQVGWVRADVKERDFTTPTGMKLNREQVKYKISEIGINHLEAGTIFRSQTSGGVNITNVNGVTVVGDGSSGSIVNSHHTDLARSLTQLDNSIAHAPDLTDEQRLNAAGNLATIRAQIATTAPDRGIIAKAWDSLKGFASVVSVSDAMGKVGGLIAGLLV